MQQPPNYYSYISAWHHTHADMYPPNIIYYDQCNKTFCCPKQEKKLNHQQLKVPWQFEKKDNSSCDQNNHSYKKKMSNQRDSFDYMLCYVHAFFSFCFAIQLWWKVSYRWLTTQWISILNLFAYVILRPLLLLYHYYDMIPL